jgi:hypothetical protein
MLERHRPHTDFLCHRCYGDGGEPCRVRSHAARARAHLRVRSGCFLMRRPAIAKPRRPPRCLPTTRFVGAETPSPQAKTFSCHPSNSHRISRPSMLAGVHVHQLAPWRRRGRRCPHGRQLAGVHLLHRPRQRLRFLLRRRLVLSAREEARGGCIAQTGSGRALLLLLRELVQRRLERVRRSSLRRRWTWLRRHKIATERSIHRR